MRYVRLQVAEDQLSGELGLKIKGMRATEGMAMGSGLLVAHDLLEHQNGLRGIGSVGDELEALGGIWHVRGQWGELQRDGYSIHTPEQALGRDIMNLAMVHNRGIPMRVEIKNTHGHDWDDAFDEMIQVGVRLFINEMKDRDEKIDYRRLDQFKQEAKHLLRTGFRKSQNRHGDGTRVNTQFWNIAEVVDQHAHTEWEGMEYVLSYGNGRAACHEYIEPEW